MLVADIDLKQQAARFQAPGKFAVHREAEQAENPVESPSRHRQLGIAPDHPGRPRILTRRCLHRPFGDVEPNQPQPARSCLRRQAAQIVAFAATGIETGQGIVAFGQHLPRQRLGNRRVDAAVQEAPPCRHHRLAIAGIARTLVLYRQQIDVALAGNIERMALRAAPGSTGALQQLRVQRAGQRVKGFRGQGFSIFFRVDRR